MLSMKSSRLMSTVKNLRTVLWNLALITAGSCICAFAIKGILIPSDFVSSGLAGLALVLHYIAPNLSVGILYLLLNIPLFLLGWKYVSRRFFLYSIAGTTIFSAALYWISIPITLNDQFLSAILAGIVMGAGNGITLRSAGSAGGTDVLSVMIQTKFSVRFGNTVLAFNGIVLSASAILFSLETALYSLFFIFVYSQVLDLVVTGFSQRKSVMIISKLHGEIIVRILKDLNRGVTIIKGQRGYSEEPVDIIYTVIAFRELARIKKMINQIDPDAFVVISDTAEVMGYRIGNQRRW